MNDKKLNTWLGKALFVSHKDGLVKYGYGIDSSMNEVYLTAIAGEITFKCEFNLFDWFLRYDKNISFINFSYLLYWILIWERIKLYFNREARQEVKKIRKREREIEDRKIKELMKRMQG